MRLLFVPHAVVFPAETMTAEGALKIPVARVDHLMAFQVLAGGEPLGALPTLKPLLIEPLDVLRLEAAAAASIRSRRSGR